jgi:putative PIN family toxin of toxin-antitoxin system
MIRAVLDSNVYISALLFGGNPRHIVEHAEHGLIELAIFDPIKAEVERVLAAKFAWPAERIAHAKGYLWSFSRHVAMRQTVTDCADPDDNRVLECALDAHAAVIVTGDAHLLKLHPYRNIAILTPKQFLDAKPWEKP